jgi:hypothetical protein
LLSSFEQFRLWVEDLILKQSVPAIRDILNENAPAVSSNAAYEKSLEMIKESKHSSYALLALAWVYYAKRPLNIVELTHALVMDNHEVTSVQQVDEYASKETAIESSCEGLVHILPSSQTFAFKHQGIREYLGKRDREIFNNLQIQLLIPKTCLRYLFLAVKSGNENPKGLFQYASKYWFQHIEENQAPGLLNDMIPVVHLPDMTTEMEKKWLSAHHFRRLPTTAMDIACELRIEWLFNFLLSSNSKELSVKLEDQWLSIAKRWPNKFEKLYKERSRPDEVPSENLALGLIASNYGGIKGMEGVVTKHAYFQVTAQMFVEAAGCDEPDQMLSLLWGHYERCLSSRRQYAVRFSCRTSHA